MANRTRSTVKALGVLGSSVRGISLMSWRKLFHALLMPVLTYGCTVWFTDTNQKSLLQILTVAQNEACWKMAGVFRTTPCSLTELLISVPPSAFVYATCYATSAHVCHASLPITTYALYPLLLAR
jgi:hypothetical protein